MIRVVIADDEEKICQLIQNLVDWKKIDMEIVGTARNGLEALNLVRALSPDLMITDIRMPGVDGLEMIRRAKSAKQNLEFIVISGYQHFKYAQEAIQYGVSDYLLKPIQKEDLLAALDRIRTVYDRRNAQAGREKSMEEQLRNSAEKLRASLFAALLAGKGLPADLTPESADAAYRFSFRPGVFRALGIKIDCGYEEECDRTVAVLKEKILRAASEPFGRTCHDFGAYGGDSAVWCILNYAPEREEDIRGIMKSLPEGLLLRKFPFENVRFTVGAGTPVHDIRELPESFRSAKLAVYQRLREGTGRLIAGAPAGAGREKADALLAELDRFLGPATELLDGNGVASCLDGLRRRAAAEKKLSGEELFYIASQAFLMFLMHLRNNRVPMGDADALKREFRTRAGRCGSEEQLFRYVSFAVSKLLDRVLEEKKQRDTRPIRQAKQYIRQHFKSPLTLEQVSGAVGFSPAYFSTLFKKETGGNFVEYLTGVRMDEAKRLLRETDLSVSSVCEQAGYSDLKYFAKNFKKYTGLKPNQYRKLYS